MLSLLVFFSLKSTRLPFLAQGILGRDGETDDMMNEERKESERMVKGWKATAGANRKQELGRLHNQAGTAPGASTVRLLKDNVRGQDWQESSIQHDS